MFWDHGHGPAYGYGVDEHRKDESGEYDPSKMPVADIVSGISASDFIENEGKFDIIEFDCCMMGNFEIALAMQDYTDYYLGCPDVDPFASLDYTAFLNFLGEDPNVDSKELGRQIVHIYVENKIVFLLIISNNLKYDRNNHYIINIAREDNGR